MVKLNFQQHYSSLQSWKDQETLLFLYDFFFIQDSWWIVKMLRDTYYIHTLYLSALLMSDVVCGGLMCCIGLKLGLIPWAIRCLWCPKFLSSTCYKQSRAAAQFMLYQLTQALYERKSCDEHTSPAHALGPMLWERTRKVRELRERNREMKEAILVSLSSSSITISTRFSPQLHCRPCADCYNCEMEGSVEGWW